jgi:hypothetical protein
MSRTKIEIRAQRRPSSAVIFNGLATGNSAKGFREHIGEYLGLGPELVGRVECHSPNVPHWTRTFILVRVKWVRLVMPPANRRKRGESFSEPCFVRRAT